ncbi:MAG: HAMP domain-containing histidine kinase [Colwellia sp.]|nr:HAMP domain-containing histidine kinase [Colwellia sp.]
MKQLFSDKRLLNYQQRINRLRCFTIIFLVLLLVPISVVFYQGFNQFEKDLLIEYKRQTEIVTYQINKRIFKRAILENALSPQAFDYYQYLYNPINKQVTRVKSPLSKPEYNERITGIIGYFQIDENGQFNSPIWPYIINSSEDLKSMDADLESVKRRGISFKLYQITTRSNELKRLIEQKLPENNDKFDFFSDVPEYFIFYRIVEVNAHTKLQGYIIDLDDYLGSRVSRVFTTAQFDNDIGITVQKEGNKEGQRYFVSHINSKGEAEVTRLAVQDKQLNLLINQQSLNWPFTGYSIRYSTGQLPLSSAEIYSISLMLLLILAITIGCYGFYRLGVKQLKLAEQRLNFVSSVSHELKTPLTSIRMYSEMLKTGMVPSEEYKTEYYEFIHSESERLSRLIENILQLSKLSQPQHTVDLQYTKLSILTDIIRSKISSLLVKSDFILNIFSDFEQPEKVMLLVDLDAFSQVVINITDNAIKFFDNESIQDESRKKIDFIFKMDPKTKDQILMEIRDYGNGISVEQQSKVFELFYRGGSELTRSTQGTGIGLALVNELVLAQQGTIEVQRMTPGLAMKMSFKCK